ncbi:MAG: ABC transporter ATP-binding protein [Candidatus Omnitrophica bacterium]|nr:ABC transporter ATP-binding protein [Candidatus Omnitrophota bacterium]
MSKSFSPVLTLQDILKFRLANKNPVSALEDINFQLDSGKILGILGPNGAGKTTLLKCLCTLIIPDKGSIVIDHYLANTPADKIKSLFGFVDNEERSFYWRLSGIQNLEFFAAMYGLTPKQTKLRINELLSIFDINYIHKRFDTYSSGMKRKLSLLRAIIHRPKILLVDELTKSLDFDTSMSLYKFIKDLSANKTTIILTSHNIPEAENLCDTFMFLKSGKIAALGSIDTLHQNLKNADASLTDIYKTVMKNA